MTTAIRPIRTEPHEAPNSTNHGSRCQCHAESIPYSDRERTSDLRIAIVIERFAPGAGGVENVAWRVAHELDRVGEDVTVITRETTESGTHAVASSGSEGGSTRGPSIRHVEAPRFWQPLRVLAFSRAAAAAQRGMDVDVVHSFSRTRHQHLYRAGGGSHADYLERMHSPAGRSMRLASPRHRVLLGIESRVFADPSQRIQCASRLVADRLIANHGVAPERILLLPNGVDTARYRRDASRTEGLRLRREIDEKADRIWLFPASGWRRKGLPVLFEALARRRDPSLHLWIAGRDDPSAWVKRAKGLGILERLRFLGPRDDLEIVYAGVDGLVLPTRYDAFANVTLEAAVAGLPVITTRANGAAEWLGDAVHTLDDAGDAHALNAAFDAFDDESRRRDFGERARAMAGSLDWSGHTAKLRDEYRRIVSVRRDRSIA